MTVVTHAAFGVLIAVTAQSSQSAVIACAIGASLPDLDHPRSAIGRVLFFVSYPLNRWFGHRKLIHSFVVWMGLMGIGFALQQPFVQWLAIGALSHVLIDCYNISGVQALLPFSDKTIVIFKKGWRIYTGSVQEILVALGIIGLIGGSQYTQEIGGPRRLINKLLKNPQITTEEFIRSGNTRCYVQGKWRWHDGRIVDPVRWLVVGTEGDDLVYWNGERLIAPRHGQFLQSVLIQSNEIWPIVEMRGLSTLGQDAFFFGGGEWYFARAGQKAFGIIKSVSGETPRIVMDR